MSKKSALHSLFFSLVVLVLGMVFLIWPLEVFQIIGYVIGGGLAVLGIWLIARFFSDKDHAAKPLADLVLGILALGSGAVLLIQPIEKLAPIIISVFMLFCALYYAKNAIEARSGRFGRWWLIIIGSAVFAALAAICAFVAFQSAVALMRISGGVMAGASILNLVSGFMNYSAARSRHGDPQSTNVPQTPVDISADQPDERSENKEEPQ